MNKRTIQLLLFVLWLIVAITFVAGVTLPIATVEKFYVFENQFSLLGSLVHLAQSPSLQNITLLLIIGLFTVIFPIAKLTTMCLQIQRIDSNWQNAVTRFIELLGHFSMVDVFVIALMVLLLKLRVLVDVSLHSGFYWFSLSIVLSIVLSLLIRHQRNKVIIAGSEGVTPNA